MSEAKYEPASFADFLPTASDSMRVSPDVQMQRDKVRLSLLQREQIDNPDDPFLPREIADTTKKMDLGDPFYVPGRAPNRGSKIAGELKSKKPGASKAVYQPMTFGDQPAAAGVTYEPMFPDAPAISKVKAANPINDTVQELGRSIWEGLTVHTPASIAAAYQGEDVSDEGISGFLIDRSTQLQKQRGAEPGGDMPSAIPGIKVKDLRELGANLGFSLTAMGAGLAAGLPAGVLGGMIAPLVGTVGGYTAGMTAAGRAGYNMDVNQITRQLKEAADEQSVETAGRKLTPEEWQAKLETMKGEIKKHGLYEAVPEAAGAGAGFAILTTAAKIFGKGVIARFASKLGALYGEEMLTETVTQIGQQAAETRMGLHPDEKERSFTSAEDWAESAKEVAPQVFLLTTLVGAAGKAAHMVYQSGQERAETPPGAQPPAVGAGAPPAAAAPAGAAPAPYSAPEYSDVPRETMSPIDQARVDGQVLSEGGSLPGVTGARLNNAMLMQVYGENAAVRHVIESPEMFGAIGEAMLKAAPTVERVRGTIAQNERQRDITDEILGAVDEITRIRKEGGSVAEMLAEGVSHDLSYEGQQLAQFLDENVDNPQALADFLENYLHEVERATGIPSEVRGRAFDIIQERRAAKEKEEAKRQAEIKKRAFERAETSAKREKAATTLAARREAVDTRVLTEIAVAKAAGSGVNQGHLTAIELAFQNALKKRGKKDGDNKGGTSVQGRPAGGAGPGSGQGPAVGGQGQVPKPGKPSDQSNPRPVRAAGDQKGAETGVDAGAHEAASSPKNGKPEPSTPQILAGNAELGHAKVSGLDISIENPEGSTREDKNNTPPKWKRKIKNAHYGYVKGVPARSPDKDHVDVFVKPGTAEDHDGPVFVVDQLNQARKFDEPKVMVGYADQKEARAAYLSNYGPGQENRIDGITEMTTAEFKAKLQDENAFKQPQRTRVERIKAEMAKPSPEKRSSSPVAESQAIAPSGPSDAGVASGQAAALPEPKPKATGAEMIKGKAARSWKRAELQKMADTDRSTKVQEAADAELQRRADIPLTEKQVAARARLARRAQNRKIIDQNNDSLLDAIAKKGGILTSERADIMGERKGNHMVPFVGYVFSPNGQGIDDMARSLGADFYLNPAELADDEGVHALREKVREDMDLVMAGKPPKHYSATRDAMSMEAEMRQRQEKAEEDALSAEMEEAAGPAAGALEFDITPEDLQNEDLVAGVETMVDADLSAKANELNPDAFERAVLQYENDDAGFMAAIKEIIYANENAEARQGGEEGRGEAPGGKAEARRPVYNPNQQGLDLAPAEVKPATLPAVAARTNLTATHPNVVVRDIRGFNAEKMGDLIEPYDGTEDGARAAAEKIADRMQDEFPDASNVQSRIGATDENGKPKWAISPNLRNISPVDSREGAYIWGDVSATPAVARPSLDLAGEAAPAVEARPSLELTGEAPVAATNKPTLDAVKNVDVGENLWANRRNFTGKILDWDSIKDLNETLKVKEVIKSKVWPRPDYEQLVADGMPAIFARLLKQVYDGIATKPAGTTDADLERYISANAKVRDSVYDWAKDASSNRTFMDAIAAEAARRSNRGPVSLTELGKRENYRDALLDRLWTKTEGMNRFARDTEGWLDLRALGGNRTLQHLQFTMDDMIGAMKDLEKGWPASQEAWQRQGYVILAPDAYKVMGSPVTRYVDGKSVETGQMYWRVDPEDGRRDGRASRVGEEIKGDQHILVRKGRILGEYATEEEAKTAAREATKREGRGGELRGMNIGEAERDGPDRRGANEDITSERLMAEFGFRGVNFGREGWINQAERQAYLNHAYDALHDLAAIMKVPPKALSLEGMLGIAFGAQGRGGNAAAHFVPGHNEINLTKTMGAGTLAHEFGHALDHYFAVQAGLAKNTDPFLSNYGKAAPGAQIRPEMLDAFRTVVEAMDRRPMTQEERDKRAADSANMGRQNLDRWLKHVRTDIERFDTAEAKAGHLAEFDQLADRLRAGDMGEGYVKVGQMRLPQVIGIVRLLIKDVKNSSVDIPSNWKGLDAAAGHVRYQIANKDAVKEHIPQTTQTTYARESYAKDKDKKGKVYWSTPWEKFARAWESYIADRLEDEAQKNTFLSDAKIRAEMKTPEGAFSSPYPRDVDRRATNTAFAKLVETLKTRETDRGVAMYQNRPSYQAQQGFDLVGETLEEGRTREAAAAAKEKAEMNTAQKAEAALRAVREKKEIADRSKTTEFALDPTQAVDKKRQAEIDRKAAEDSLAGQNSLFQKGTPYIESGLADLRAAFDKYDDAGELTERDLVDEVEGIIENQEVPGADALEEAVRVWRDEKAYDTELAGRGDMDAANEAFVAALRAYLNSNEALFQPKPDYNEKQLELIYDKAETRPDTTQAQKDQGILALKALFGRKRVAGEPVGDNAGGGTATLLGSALWKSFKERQGAELIGQEVRTPQDLATLAQILRDPRFETLRFFFVKDGKIVGHTGVTSRLPGSVSFVGRLLKGTGDQAFDREVEKLRKTKLALKADGYYVLHNHPSGTARPSNADISMTAQFAESLTGFKGHVVIDHNQYALIGKGAASSGYGGVTMHQIDSGPAMPPEVAHEVLGRTIQGPHDVIGIAKDIQATKGYAVLIGQTGIEGRVQAIAEIPEEQLYGQNVEQRMKAIVRVRHFGRYSGSLSVFVVSSNPDLHDFLIKDGVARDVVSTGGTSRASQGVSMTISKDYRAGKVRAEQMVWHGSPYIFEAVPGNPYGQFDASKVGSGEGAQAYGWGAAYLAGRKEVAAHYKDVLGGAQYLLAGRPVNYANIKRVAAEIYGTEEDGRLAEHIVWQLQSGYHFDDVERTAKGMSNESQVLKILADIDLLSRDDVGKIVMRVPGIRRHALQTNDSIGLSKLESDVNYQKRKGASDPLAAAKAEIASALENIRANNANDEQRMREAEQRAAGMTDSSDLIDNGRLQTMLKDSLRNGKWFEEEYASALKMADIAKPIEIPKTGRLYQVDMGPKDEEFLSWDLPLAEQSYGVRASLEPALARLTSFINKIDYAEADMLKAGKFTGEGLYRRLKDMALSYDSNPANKIFRELGKNGDAQEAASKYLASLGIPGIRYLDNASRPVASLSAFRAGLKDAQAKLKKWQGNNSKVGKAQQQSHQTDIDYYTRMIKEAEAITPVHNYVIFETKHANIVAVEQPKSVYTVNQNALDQQGAPYTIPQQAGYRATAQRVVDRIDQALNPLGTLPDQAKYLSRRGLAQGTIDKSDTAVKDMAAVLGKATEGDAKLVYDYLTTAGAQPGRIQDQTIRIEAVRLKETINRIGDELVEHGLLSEESREAYRDAYLPRLYLKHLLSEGDWKALGAGKKPSDMGYLKQRKDIPEEVRRILLGEITDPGFLAGVALAKPVRDMALLDWLADISQNENWVLPGTVVPFTSTVTGKTMRVTPYWLKEEAIGLRRRARHYDSEDAAAARAEADAMDEVADEALEGISGEHSDYKQIPNTPRYGRLRGLYVRTEIYNDLMGVADALPTDPGWFQSVFGYGGIGTRATGVWKGMKVAMNPPSQIRNFISNAIATQLFGGVPLRKVPQRVFEAIHEIRTGGKHYQISKEYGVASSTFATQEVYRMKTELLDLEMKTRGLSPMGRMHRLAALIFNKAGDFYQLSETIFKTAVIIDAMERQGMGKEQAVALAQHALFDYSLIQKSARYARSAPIGIPFLCVAEDTDILTSDGWKTIDQVNIGDIAASFNMDTQVLEWKPILDVYRAKYDAELVHVKDRHLDMLMTPDHRVVTYRKRRVVGKRATNEMRLSLELQQAQDLTVADHIPTAAPFAHVAQGEPVSDAMVEVIGWFVTEGHLHRKCKQVIISQNEGEKADMIRGALNRAGFIWRETKATRRGNVELQFHIRAVFGAKVRALCGGKQLRMDFVRRLTVPQIRLLIDTMILADGHTSKKDGRRCFIQNASETLESFQAALTMAGISYSVRPHNGSCFNVLLRDATVYCVKRATKARVQYKGRIWCPMVADNQTWVARRNGKPFITHNTYQIKVLPRLIEAALLHPQRFLPWVGLFYGFPMMAAAMLDVDDDDLDKLKMALPEWLQEKGHALILPWKDENGRFQAVDLGYYMPWGNWADLAGDIKKGELGSAVSTAGIFSGPVTSIIVAIKTGKDPFTGYDIWNKGDPPQRQLASILNYMWSMSAPPFITERGILSPTGLMNKEYGGKLVQALAGTTNKMGEPRSTLTQAMLYMGGFNLKGMTPEYTRAQNLMKMQREIGEVKLALRYKLYDQSLSPQRKLELVQEYTDELKKRAAKITQYMRASEIAPSLRQ